MGCLTLWQGGGERISHGDMHPIITLSLDNNKKSTVVSLWEFGGVCFEEHQILNNRVSEQEPTPPNASSFFQPQKYNIGSIGGVQRPVSVDPDVFCRTCRIHQ